MKKLVALEQIKGLASKTIYAEKHDELEFLSQHDDEISCYQNLRTGEKFHCRTKRVAEIEHEDIILFVETEQKQIKANNKKRDVGSENQLNLFQ
jgi:hypothetical protein